MSNFPLRSLNGLPYSETKISRNKWSYWIKTGEGENDLIHIDAKEQFTPDEVDVFVEFMNYASGLPSEKRPQPRRELKKAHKKKG